MLLKTSESEIERINKLPDPTNDESAAQILGIAKDSTAEEIMAAYKKLARLTHPDKHPDNPAATTAFQKVDAAKFYFSEDNSANRLKSRIKDFEDRLENAIKDLCKKIERLRALHDQCLDNELFYYPYNSHIIIQTDANGIELGTPQQEIAPGLFFKESTLGSLLLHNYKTLSSDKQRMIRTAGHAVYFNDHLVDRSTDIATIAKANDFIDKFILVITAEIEKAQPKMAIFRRLREEYKKTKRHLAHENPLTVEELKKAIEAGEIDLNAKFHVEVENMSVVSLFYAAILANNEPCAEFLAQQQNTDPSFFHLLGGNAQNKKKCTLLHYLAYKTPEQACLMLKVGVRLGFLDEEGKTPLDYALERFQKDSLDYKKILLAWTDQVLQKTAGKSAHINITKKQIFFLYPASENAIEVQRLLEQQGINAKVDDCILSFDLTELPKLLTTDYPEASVNKQLHINNAIKYISYSNHYNPHYGKPIQPEVIATAPAVLKIQENTKSVAPVVPIASGVSTSSSSSSADPRDQGQSQQLETNTNNASAIDQSRSETTSQTHTKVPQTDAAAATLEASASSSSSLAFSQTENQGNMESNQPETNVASEEEPSLVSWAFFGVVNWCINLFLRLFTNNSATQNAGEVSLSHTRTQVLHKSETHTTTSNTNHNARNSCSSNTPTHK